MFTKFPEPFHSSSLSVDYLRYNFLLFDDYLPKLFIINLRYFCKSNSGFRFIFFLSLDLDTIFFLGKSDSIFFNFDDLTEQDLEQDELDLALLLERRDLTISLIVLLCFLGEENMLISFTIMGLIYSGVIAYFV